MLDIELKGKVRLGIPVLALAGAYVAYRYLKDKGTDLPIVDECADKVRHLVQRLPMDRLPLGKLFKTSRSNDVHAAIAMALAESGLAGERRTDGAGVGPKRVAARQLTAPTSSAWSSKIQTMRRNPGQD